MESLIARYPAAAPIVARMLKHIEEMQPDEASAGVVEVFYNFCRAHPTLALLMTALAHAADGDQGGVEQGDDGGTGTVGRGARVW